MRTFLAVNSQVTSAAPAMNGREVATADPTSARCEWNLQSNSWEWDPELPVIFGHDADHFVASASTILLAKHPDDLELTRLVLNAVQRRGLGYSYETRLARADGYVRRIHSAALVSLDSHGLPALVSAAVEARSDWMSPLADCELSSATDGELMLGLRARMPEALGEAYRRHSGHVAQLARTFGSISTDDVVQDVFEALFRSPERFDARRGSLRTFLNLSTRTRCFDALRSQQSRVRRDEAAAHSDQAPAADMEALRMLSVREIQAALAVIRLEERAAIELAFFGGFSYRALAELLGIPEGTAKGRIRSGLFRLRSVLSSP